MPTLHYFPISQPSRALKWFLANHNITLDEKIVDLMTRQNLSQEFGKLSMYQSVPILELDDGQVITESGAILIYLALQFGPSKEYPRDDVLAQTRIVEALLHHETLARIVTTQILRPALGKIFNPSITWEAIKGQIEKNKDDLQYSFGLLEKLFTKQEYAAGNEWSIVDYLVACELNQLPALQPLLPEGCRIEHFPKIAAYLGRVKGIQNHDKFVEDFSKFAVIFKSAEEPKA